jgi:uncharacterized protein (DUF488 family)
MTLGLGHRPVEEILMLLARAGCRLVADIRTNPADAIPPHFARMPLVSVLEEAGIGYRWFRALGKMDERRAAVPASMTRIAAAPHYLPRLNEPGFRWAARELAGVAASTVVVAIAQSADPHLCHRWILSDLMHLMQVRVVHILNVDEDLEHTCSGDMQIEEGVIHYVDRQLDLSMEK